MFAIIQLTIGAPDLYIPKVIRETGEEGILIPPARRSDGKRKKDASS